MKPEQLKYSILKKAFSGQLVMVDPDSEKPKVKVVELEEAPFDIPDDWFWSNLGNCCEMYTGNSISESVKKAKYTGLKEGFDYIATKDVSFEHTIEYDNGIRIPVDDNFRRAYSGSVLMCIEGGSAGRKIGILDRDVCFGNKLCTFNSQEIINSYIYYYLQSHEFKAFFMDNMSGIIGGVSIKKLKSLPIPVPTVSEQKAIVAKIEELLPYVDRYAEAYEKLEQFNAKFPEDMKKSILQYAIQGKLVEQRPEEGTAEDLYKAIQEEKQKLIKEGKIKKEKPLAEITEDEIPFDIPSTWKWDRLGNLLVIERGGSPRPIKDFITTDENGINWIKIGDTEKGSKYINSCAEKIIPEGMKKSRYVEKGDFILSNSMSFGRPYILNIDGCIHDGWLVLRQPVQIFDNDYLYYLLSSPMVFYQFCGRVAGAVVNNLNSDKVALTLVPIPPIEEQKRIAKKIEEMLPYCDQLIK